MIDRYGPLAVDARTTWALDLRSASRSLARWVVVILSAWILHSFLQAILAACITAVASWPLYTRFANALPTRARRSATPLAFTALMVVFVLAPLVFAFGALLNEAHALIVDVGANERGATVPGWIENLPLIGPWAIARWHGELASPGTLMLWVQQTDPARLLGWLQSLGLFTAHHLITIGFAVLLLYVLYQQGEALAQGCRRVLRQRLGAGVEHYVGVGTRALRASVNSMLIVGVFDGLAIAIAFSVAGVPRAAVWAAIIASLALVPFLGYVVVIGLALYLAAKGAAAAALLSVVLGCAILLAGDKVVRPVVAREGVGLPFVWLLMGCLGGFEVLGFVGLVVGPVVLTLARDLWQRSIHDRSKDNE